MASMESVKVWKKLLIDGVPYEVMKSEHLKVAMGKGMEKTSLKNLLTGNVVQKTFREVDKIEMADIASSSAEFLYSDDTDYHFMNTETYDQFSLNNAAIGDNKLYLCEWDKVIVQIFNNRPINVNLEATVTLPVVETPPGEKGDTATGGKKPATLLTGLVVQVPLFIKVGDRLRVDTRTGEYLSRVQ